VPAHDVPALAGEESRAPEDEGNPQVLLVEPRSVAPGVVGIAEGLSVVPGHGDQGVVGDPALPQGLEQAAELAIGLEERVQVSAEIVVVGGSRWL